MGSWRASWLLKILFALAVLCALPFSFVGAFALALSFGGTIWLDTATSGRSPFDCVNVGPVVVLEGT